MTIESKNRVRELREARGLSQVSLAAMIGLARQSLHAIEMGRATPAVDVALRLARVLDSSVETLFGDATADRRLVVESVIEGGNADPGRVALAHIGGRLLSYSLAREGIRRSADAMIARSKANELEVEVLRPIAEAHENVILMGCAPALGLLADRLNSTVGPGRFLWFGQSSTVALRALSRRQTHVAGVHLVDVKTGEANVPDVRRHAQSTAMVLVTLARWEMGLVQRKEAPKRITKVSQLAKKSLRLVAREVGSGARRLLERELKQAGLSVDCAKQARVVASGHLEVAQAVAMDAGDVGIATRDAAIAFGLEFLPLTEERYDLVVPRDDLGDPRIVRLFDVLTAAPFRRELSSLGYDVGPSGDRVAEISAA